MSRKQIGRPPTRGKVRPQITTDPTTYSLAKALAREDGGSVSSLVRTLVRRSALQYFQVSTVREALKLATDAGAIETRAGAA